MMTLGFIDIPISYVINEADNLNSENFAKNKESKEWFNIMNYENGCFGLVGKSKVI